MTSRVTIKDIASACDCSVTTVSFILNDKCKNISQETIDRVNKVVKELGYAPSISAASLKTKKSQVVGLIVPDIENDFYIKIIRTLEQLLYKEKYSLSIISTSDDYDKEIKAIDMFKRRGVDFLVLVPGTQSLSKENVKKYKETLENLQFDYIVLDRKVDGIKSLQVVNDDILGGRLGTEFLIKNKYKKIACITGPKTVSSSVNRLLGYKETLKKYNIDFDESMIFEGNYRYESGVSLGRKILKNKDIQAIFCFNDLMAYGLYSVCAEMKIEVGKDIQIIGYDDNTFSSLITPSLTTVKLDVKKMSEIIFKNIFSQNKQKNEVKVKPTLVIRNSVGVKK